MNRRESHLYEFGPFRLYPGEHILLRGGEPVALTPKAFETLVAQVERGGRLVGKEELLKEVWPETFVEEGSLARNIHELRRALGEGPTQNLYIETVPKRGYRFVAPVRDLGEEGGRADPTAAHKGADHHRGGRIRHARRSRGLRLE